MLQEYARKQSDELERLQAIQKELRLKKKKYMAMNEEINDQALHFEIMINRLRPDLLKETQQEDGAKTLQPSIRPDVRFIQENPSVAAKSILIE